jgi:hypothetical protein
VYFGAEITMLAIYTMLDSHLCSRVVEVLVRLSLGYVRSQSALVPLSSNCTGHRPSPRQKLKNCFSSMFKTILMVRFGQKRSPKMESELIVGSAIFSLLITLLAVLVRRTKNFPFTFWYAHMAMSLGSATSPTCKIFHSSGKLRFGTL